MTTLSTPPVAEESPRVDAVCTVLDDEHAREVLDAVASEGKTIRELVADCSGSRTTIYRRLDRLEAAGLVRTEMVYDPDGHHRRLYHARHSAITVTLEGDGLTVEVVTEGQSSRPDVDGSRSTRAEVDD